MGKLITALIALSVSTSAPAGGLAVNLPGHGSLAMSVPHGWVATVRRARDDLPPTVLVTAKAPNTFQMLVTPIWPMGSGKGVEATGYYFSANGEAAEPTRQALEMLKAVDRVAPNHATTN